MITKIAQVGKVGPDGEYKVMGEIILVIDTDREEFVMHQLQLKQYLEMTLKNSTVVLRNSTAF